MRKLPVIMLCLVFWTCTSISADVASDYSELFTDIATISVIDSFVVAAGPTGIGVCIWNEAVQRLKCINAASFDEEPVEACLTDGRLVLQTTDGNLTFLDVTNLPDVAILGSAPIPVDFAALVVHGQEVFLSRWYEGISHYRLADDFQSMAFVDSSLKGVNVTQLIVKGDSLYGLDTYNGILRFDISGGHLNNALSEYLLIPDRPSCFGVGDEHCIIAHSPTSPKLAIGEFGHEHSGLVSTREVASLPARFLVGEGYSVAYSPSAITAIRHDSLENASTIPIRAVAPQGAVFNAGGRPVLLLPGATSTPMVMVDLATGVTSYAVWERNGAYSAIAVLDSLVLSAGASDPTNVARLTPDSTIEAIDIPGGIPDSIRVMTRAGDSLLAFYGAENHPAVISFTRTTRGDSAVVTIGPAIGRSSDLTPMFVPRPESDGDLVMLGFRDSVVVFRLDEHAVLTPLVAYGLGSGVTAMAWIDSLVYASVSRGKLIVFALGDAPPLAVRSVCDLVTAPRALVARPDQVWAFMSPGVHIVDCANPLQPRVIDFRLPERTALAATVDNDRLFTIGSGGLAVYDLDWNLLHSGNSTGSLLSVDNGLVATSDNFSVQVYNLNQFAVEPTPPPPPDIPDHFTLAQNYPNPFNAGTTIRFDLPDPAHVSLVVYNIMGQRVRTLTDTDWLAGEHSIVWDGAGDNGRTVASGVYFYRCSVNDTKIAKKMILLK